MNLVQRWVLTCSVVAAGLPAQLVAPHPPGVVIPARIDEDGCGDFFVHEGVWLRSYLGTEQPPYVRPGQVTELRCSRWGCRPVVSGRFVYTAYVPTVPASFAWVQVHEIQRDGCLHHIVDYRLNASASESRVRSFEVVPLDRDFGNDGFNDVLVVWAETPIASSLSLRAVLMSPWRVGPEVDLPPLAFRPQQYRVMALHAARNVAQPRHEVLCVLSSPADGRFAGNAFVTLDVSQDRPRAVAEHVEPHGPALAIERSSRHRSSSVYARFAPTPALATPIVRTELGPSYALSPSLQAPFVGPMGHWLLSSRDAYFLDHANADFDADGADELVVIERGPGTLGDVVIVLDPARVPGAYAQVFRYVPRGPASNNPGTYVHTPYDGAAVDLDGDGNRDLVLSCFDQVNSRSWFSVMLGNRRLPGDRRGLLRIY